METDPHPLTFWKMQPEHSQMILERVDTTKLYLNQSRAQLFNNCKRKFYWWDIRKLELDRPRWALDIGTSVHLGLAALGGGKSIDEAVKESTTKLKSLMPKHMLPGDHEGLEDALIVVEKLLRGYVEHWEGQTQWVPIAQETKGVVEVGDNTLIFLVFRTDKLATWNNRLWIVDHKTAGKLDLRDLMKYEMALQFTSYSYGITKLLKQRVAGVIVDVLVKTKTPQYARDLKTRTDEELIEFEKEFAEIGKEIVWRKARVAAGEDPKTIFYKNTDECFRYGACAYRELCLEETSTRLSVFRSREADYVDEPNTKSIDTIEAGR